MCWWANQLPHSAVSREEVIARMREILFDLVGPNQQYLSEDYSGGGGMEERSGAKNWLTPLDEKPCVGQNDASGSSCFMPWDCKENPENPCP